MVAIWGPEGILVYNQGYAEVCGPRHPQALGGRLLEVWPEARAFNARVIESGRAGRALSFRAREFELRRSGRPETVWMDLDYTPLLGEDGAPLGVLATVLDITARVLGERRVAGSESRFRFLDRLAQATAEARDADAVLTVTTRLVGEHLGLSNCAYADMDPDGDGFTIRGNWHAPGSPSILGHYRLADFGALAVRELNAGRPLIINDTLAEIAPREAKTFQDIGIAATICMPLVKRGRLTALMAIHHAAPHRWSQAELALIREVTERCWAHIERVGAEANLRMSEGRLRALVDATADAVYRMSPDWEEMRRLDGGGFLADMAEPSPRWRDLYLEPEDRPEVEAAIADAIRRRGLFALEHRVRRADGGIGWTLSRAVPLLDGAGEVIEWFGTASDVTFRHEAEARLRESEARFRTMADDAPVMTWITEASGTCIYLNRRWFEFTGQTPEEGLGLGWLDAVHPDDRGRSEQAFLAANARREPIRVEYRLRRHDGSYRWALDSASPRLDPDGTFLGYFGSVVDIDERREAEARLRTLTDVVPAFVWFAAPDGRLHFMNSRWCEYTGQTPEEVLPDGWIAAVHPDDQAQTAAIWAEARAGGVSYEVELRYRRHDGAYRWYVARAEPLRDASGRVTTWFGTSTDIHDRKLAEASLRELNETLESRVAERTAELLKAEEALRQSQKMEAVGQLTGGVAHDFNNLLTIIRSSVDFLRRPDLPEARKARYLDAVSDTVDRAAKLTSQLLAFARRQTLDPQVFSLGERLRAVADLLETVTGARIRVVTEIPETPCFVRADLSQFETALVNMAVNARDAMEGEGTLTLRLTCAGRLPPIRGHAGSTQPFAAVSLSDTGTGIAPEVQERIFEPFFTTKEVGKGTGLGLSQVFGFAKQSGGDVDVASVLGRGTTFTLYLPEVAAQAPGARDAGAAAAASPVGTGQRVLVVEDNVEVGSFATQILEDLGYETTWAVNAEEALDRLGPDGSGFDVVFSDVVMPGMGGLALAQQLRQRLPHLPVLLASGYSHVLAQDGQHGFKLLHKPYSAEQLGRLLRQVTARPPHEGPVPPP
ncbi:multi-sensor hybrid histidine kinase [Methylobacterium sp. 4-46]|uniref:PAS domain S-box protein n=1 Tax=unclassified Methylobacterium TaxID=2615210 RepID=UPI000165C6D4|nr:MULTISPECIES: PAS domain S-box protein [Methylobacterium]ACA15584.1 multi-sensor hybrid histidine kinase [Methylobacterium sp. 4-46]WFT83500.1 PAS domain S-box protein [Methylobacterium nodulans]